MRARKRTPDKHGSTTQYLYGCRCDECRKAHAEYGRTHRAALRASLLEFWQAKGIAYPFAEWLRDCTQLRRAGGDK